ncbi:HlyC/CorC family transporter [Candidatus Thiosymbion oneisti]|uniref:HlyC/CorC family transporter n=1 Tax=Candidatus Thiosymbion oneisti TaxID=589554 RepID=UPI000A6F70B1|nr:transporter associated domain-containing protein [Candidatus Thiosymbion oneisti]
MTSVRARLGSQVRAWLKKLGRLIGCGPQDREQLVELLQDARSRALFDAEALSMLEGVLQVADLRVRDIMIPRADVVCVRRDDPLEEILRVAVESAHSRFPVIGDDKGEVVGMLLAKDMLPLCVSSKEQRAFNIRDLLRSAVFVPESKRLNVLLKEFRTSRNHMAIVVDEYGNAAGVVTIEDVLEQIVGEIEDEHDFDEGPPIFKRSAREYTAKARTTIEEFNDYFGSDLPDAAFDTIGGLVVNAFGRLPKQGERIQVSHFRFTVMRADSRRIHLLGVQPLKSQDPEGEDSEGEQQADSAV